MTSDTLGRVRSAGAAEAVRVARVRDGAIRILDVCNVDSSANTILKHRVLAMRERGIDNRIACVPGPYVRVLEEAGIPVVTVPMPRGFQVGSVLRTFWALVHYLRRERIDLVHTHFSVPGFIGRLAARVAGVPAIVHTIHGYPYHAKSSRGQRAFYILLERLVGGIADLVLSQNRGDMEDAIRYRIVPRERLRFIGNGIRIDRFRPPRRALPEIPTIVCVARLEPVKHHEMLLDAVGLLERRGVHCRVLLVGGGEREALEARCDRLGIRDRVEFLGYRDDVPDLLAHADLAALTSIKEGVPRFLLESMAMGLPVVATRIPGNLDAVRDGETGFLVEVDDVEALAERLARLVADPALRARMGARGRARVLEEFDEQRIIEALVHLYRGVLLKKGVVRPAAVPQTVTS